MTEEVKGLDTLNEENSKLVNDYMNSAGQLLDSMLEGAPEGEVPKNYAFQLYKVGTDDMCVILPANIHEYKDIATLGLIALIRQLKFPTKIAECEPFKISCDDSCKRFFKAFYMVLRRPPNAGEKITFKTKNDSTRGSSAAKFMLLKASCDEKLALTFLPSEATEGVKRTNILRSYLAMLAGREKPDTMNKYINTYMFIIDRFIEKVALKDWGDLCNNYTIPMGTALQGLHKTKKVTKVVNRKKVEVKETINPKPPSTRIEILNEAERKIIQAEEKCFHDYKRLVFDTETKCTKNIPLREITTFRKEAGNLINEMWGVVQKWSPTLTKRMKIYHSFIKDAKLPEKMSAEGWKTFITYLSGSRNLSTTAKALGPIHLIRHSCTIMAEDKQKCENYWMSLHPKYLENLNSTCLRAFGTWLEDMRYVREADDVDFSDRMRNAYSSLQEMGIGSGEDSDNPPMEDNQET